MGYWTIWVGCLIGVFLGIIAFRTIVHEFKLPTIIGLSVAVLIICGCYWGSYYLEYGYRPNFSGLSKLILGVWGEAKAFFAKLTR